MTPSMEMSVRSSANPESRNHHQLLKKFGRDKVHNQIERVITIMKLCNNMDDFRERFARVSRRAQLNYLSSILISQNDRGGKCH
jgi:hypothetical protein